MSFLCIQSSSFRGSVETMKVIAGRTECTSIFALRPLQHSRRRRPPGKGTLHPPIGGAKREAKEVRKKCSW
ncbi:MAG: hypothetical protein CSA32_03435 [Desulfobulbus propionicus]|nr:MAG: hypothetical protein CSA32_03435 [Desulfobulbus propionicus]